MNKFLFLFLLLPATGFSQNSETISSAYRAIPHRQTTYLASSSTLDKNFAEHLEILFSLVDKSVVLRVDTLKALKTSKAEFEKALASYKIEKEKITDSIKKSLSGSERQAFELIIQALDQQENYFQSKRNKDTSFWSSLVDTGRGLLGTHEQPIKESSRLLVSAYQVLMKTYPNESKHNKQAFFDHLCALDFI